MLYISCIDKEGNADDDFTEDVRTFLIPHFKKKLIHNFQGCEQ